MDGSFAETKSRMPRPGEIPVSTPDAPRPSTPMPALSQAPIAHATPADFIAANRIHVKDGSYFIGPGLTLHPRTLDPKNEPALRAELKRAYQYDAPSFYDDPKRATIALQLGALIPMSLEAERASLMGAVSAFNAKLENKLPDQAAVAATYRMPMQTMAAEMEMQGAEPNPAGLEHARSGVAFYMLLREAMSRKGYLKTMPEYIAYMDTPDQILNELSSKLNIPVRDLRETALHGLGAVAQKLGIDDDTAYDITALADYLTKHRFSANAVEHWHLGRNLVPKGSIEEKIAAGFAARIDRDVPKMRGLAHGIYEVPEAIKAEEKRIAEALELIEPAERDVLYRLNYNICYTPDRTADKIADFPGILGLHRTLANNLNDIDSNRTIYFAGQIDLKKSLRTLRHEIAHNLWPNRFSNEERATIDQHVEADYTRLQALHALTTHYKTELKNLVDAYLAADVTQKAAIAEEGDVFSAQFGVKISEILPHLKGVEQFSWLVDEAYKRLNIEGDLYNRTGYHGASTRFREMISRYSELQYIEHREEPNMQAILAFTVPGMTHIFRDFYLPHIEKLGQELATGKKPDAAPESAMPQPRIATHEIVLHERVQSALSALSQLGIDPSGNHTHGGCAR